MSAQDEIFKWVREFPPWKRELFIRAAAAPEISASDAELIASMLLGDGPDDVRPREIERSDLPTAEDAEEPMVIEMITGLRNVNALDDKQTLSFEAEGVNVVWGENGAGKTSYSRVLKKAGRTLYPEEVLANVYAEAGEGPRATLVVRVGDVTESHDLDLSGETPAGLGRICIADYRAGKVYLSDETEVDYVPATLAGLTRLADGLNAVKAVLERRRDAITIPPLDLAPFAEGTAVRAMLAGLGPETTEEQVRSLAGLNREQTERRDELRKALGEIEAMQAPKLRAGAEREARDLRALESDLVAIAAELDAEAIAAAAQRGRDLAEARAAADLAARRFADQQLPEVGSNPWRALWHAAERYAEHIRQDLPAEHDPAYCPLCQQELDAEARKRLGSFRDFVANDVNARRDRLASEADQVSAGLPDLGVIRDRHADTLALLGTENCEPGPVVKTWLDQAAVSLGRLRAGDLDGLEPLTAAPDLTAAIAARDAEAVRQGEIEKGASTEELRTELADLEARELLGERIEDVLARRAGIVEVERYGQVIPETTTAGVSRKIGTFTEELVKKGLEQALKRQFDALEFRDIEVVPTTRTVRGTPVAGLAFKTVKDVPLTAVLSEGEQRRLALAMFLAEMEVRDDRSPVVFDDPTSSIDQEGRRRIARTLLKLGDRRQVIVFTHELSLLVELERYETLASRVSAQNVKRLGDTVGHVFPGLPWDGLSPKERYGYLNEKLIDLKKDYAKNDTELYQPKAEHFCKLLRSAFERTVEVGILCNVIVRRSDTVTIPPLREINWTPEICNLLDRGVDENSPWVHDRPFADGSSPPGPDELQEGLDVLAELLEKIEDCRKEQRKEKDTRKKERRRPLKAVELIAEEKQEGPSLKPVPEPSPEPEIVPPHDPSSGDTSEGGAPVPRT